MNEFFLKIVNMSISASWLILAVLILRLFIKRAPKCITVLLWGIVAVRLICPISIESVMSLVPSAETISYEITVDSPSDSSSDIPDIDHDTAPTTGEEHIQMPDTSVSAAPKVNIISIVSLVWISGAVIMLAYTAVSYFRLKSKIATAVLLRDNIFQSENVVSPFVLGVVKPKIYLPFNMKETDIELVSAHENAHIRRKDHIWKPLGFLILTIHWFNPLVWFGYVILCKDIELACDEKVIKNFDTEQKADYSQALLVCSVNRRMIAACPLAFGEVSVKERVKSVISYKKPAFWIIIAAILVSVIVAVCFLTNPQTTENEPDAQTLESTSDTQSNESEISEESTVPEESTDVTTVDTEETAEKTIEDAKTIGEALEILFPDVDLDIENISKLGVRYSDIKPSIYVEDKAEVSAILDTVKNAPLISYEDGEGMPGWFASVTFYSNDGEKLFGFRAGENAIYFNYGGDRLTTKEGYFAELCEFIELMEETTAPKETIPEETIPEETTAPSVVAPNEIEWQQYLAYTDYDADTKHYQSSDGGEEVFVEGSGIKSISGTANQSAAGEFILNGENLNHLARMEIGNDDYYGGLYLGISMNLYHLTADNEFIGACNEAVTVSYDGSVVKDSAATANDFFTISINGNRIAVKSVVMGKGNGHQDYYFVLDTDITRNDIKEIAFEWKAK